VTALVVLVVVSGLFSAITGLIVVPLFGNGQQWKDPLPPHRTFFKAVAMR